MNIYWILYGLIFLSLLFCSIWTSSAFAIGFTAFLIIMPLVSLLFFERSCEKMNFHIDGNFNDVSGEVVLEIVCEKNTWIPISNVDLLVRFENILFQSNYDRIFSFFPKRGTSIFPLTDIVSNCGQQQVLLKEAYVYDFFRLFKRKIEINKKWDYLTYPYPVHIQLELNQSIKQDRSGEIYDPKRKGNDPSEVFNLRGYEEGDSLKSVHWKLTAKTGNLVVREFSRPINYKVLILCDASIYHQNKKVQDEVNNAIYSLAFSISEQFLLKQFPHFIGQILGEDFNAYAIDSPTSLDMAKDEMMLTPFQKSNDDTSIHFISNHLYDHFTKVIFITSGIQNLDAENIAKFVDLSILIPAYHTERAKDFMGSYEMISLDIENIKNNQYQISL